MEIAFADLFKMIKKRWLLIFLLIVVGTTAAGLISFYVLKPQYEATSTLLINHDNKGAQSSFDVMISNDKLLKTYNEMIKSRQVIDKVISDLQVKSTADDLANRVTVKADNDSLITSITVTAGDPKQAALIANEFANTSMQKLNTIMGTRIFVPLDAATVPANAKPVSPRPYFNMAVAFVLAAMIGVGLSITLEFLDTTLQTEEQVEAVLQVPVLGVIPAVKLGTASEEVQQNKALGGVAHES